MGTDLASTLDANKYLIVEKHLKQAISNGVYQPDDKLPSIRQLSTELKVSKNTVIRAYQELEAQSMVYSVPKSGYRVKPTERHEAKIAKPTRVDLLSVCKQILTYPSIKSCFLLAQHTQILTRQPSKVCMPKLAARVANRVIFPAIINCHRVMAY